MRVRVRWQGDFEAFQRSLAFFQKQPWRSKHPKGGPFCILQTPRSTGCSVPCRRLPRILDPLLSQCLGGLLLTRCVSCSLVSFKHGGFKANLDTDSQGRSIRFREESHKKSLGRIAEILSSSGLWQLFIQSTETHRTRTSQMDCMLHASQKRCC